MTCAVQAGSGTMRSNEHNIAQPCMPLRDQYNKRQE
jgi:hypothetical protein